MGEHTHRDNRLRRFPFDRGDSRLFVLLVALTIAMVVLEAVALWP